MTHRVGAGGTEIWRFQVTPEALKSGETITIHMVYTHPWVLVTRDQNLSMQTHQVILQNSTHQLVIHVAQSPQKVVISNTDNHPHP